jgi:ubiquinone biosynthesis protein COQ4
MRWSRVLLMSYGGKLYNSHVETSLIQRLVLTAGSAIGSIINPERADLVFTFGEVSGWYALQCMRYKMLQNDNGREILKYISTCYH